MAEKAEWNHITRVFDKKSTASTRELVEVCLDYIKNLNVKIYAFFLMICML